MRVKPETSQYKEQEEDRIAMEAELRRRKRRREFSMWEILGVNPPDPIDYPAILYEEKAGGQHKVFLRNEQGNILLFDKRSLAEHYLQNMTAGDPETRLIEDVGAAVWRGIWDVISLTPTIYDSTFETAAIVDDTGVHAPTSNKMWTHIKMEAPRMIDMYTVLKQGEPMRWNGTDQSVVFTKETLAISAQAITGQGAVHPIRVAHHTEGFQGRPIRLWDQFAIVPQFGKSADYQRVRLVEQEIDLSGLDLIEP